MQMRRMGGVTAMQAELRQHRQVAAAAAAVHAGGRQGMFAGGGEELGGHWHRTPDHSPYQQMTSGWDERQYLQPSDVTDGLTSSGSPCSGDGGGLASAAAVQPDSAVTPSAPPPPPRRVSARLLSCSHFFQGTIEEFNIRGRHFVSLLT